MLLYLGGLAEGQHFLGIHTNYMDQDVFYFEHPEILLKDEDGRWVNTPMDQSHRLHRFLTCANSPSYWKLSLAYVKKLMDMGGGSFVSRGDDSGTHGKEKAIWQSAGFDYETVQEAGEWYIEAGRGMGPTLLMASEKQAYTITDMGTFLSYMGELELVLIVDEGDILLNVYSAIVVSPESNPKTEIDLANELIAFLTSPEIQELIGNYGVEEYGMQLFIPCAENEPLS